MPCCLLMATNRRIYGVKKILVQVQYPQELLWWLRLQSREQTGVLWDKCDINRVNVVSLIPITCSSLCKRVLCSNADVLLVHSYFHSRRCPCLLHFGWNKCPHLLFMSWSWRILVSVAHQSRQPVRPRITTGWTATRTKHWTQRRWGAGEKKRASNSGNRNVNSR